MIPAALGAIIAAAVAGGFSFLLSVLSKDQKTSEFRQAWIEGLRADISDFISIMLVFSGVVRNMRRDGKGRDEVMRFLIEKDERLCKIEAAEARIKLRLNPKEHVTLLSKVAALHDYASSEKLMDPKEENRCVEELITESQLVLKAEWKRVKRGEVTFVITKAVSLIFMLIAIHFAWKYSAGHLKIEFIP